MSDLSGIPLPELAFGLADALERQSHALWEAKKAEEQAGQFRAELGRRLTVGEVIPVDEATQVACLPAKAGNRSVDKDAILRHAEALDPLGLTPRESVKLSWPTVAQVLAAAYAIERAGIDPQSLLVPGASGEPRIEVRSVDRA